MVNSNQREQIKVNKILVIGGVILAGICITGIIYLLNQNISGKEIPQFGIVTLTSLASGIIGYLFGRGTNNV